VTTLVRFYYILFYFIKNDSCIIIVQEYVNPGVTVIKL